MNRDELRPDIKICNDCIPVPDAARRMGVSREWLREAIKEKNVPFPAFARPSGVPGGKWFFTIPREGFENWMAGKTPPTAKEIAKELAKELAPQLPDLFFHCFNNNQQTG